SVLRPFYVSSTTIYVRSTFVERLQNDRRTSLPGITNSKFEVRRIDRADFEFEEQALSALGADHDVETCVGVRITLVRHEDVQRRSRPRVQVPGTPVRELVDELHVRRDQHEVVADANFDVRTEIKAIDEGRSLEVPAKIKLIGVDRDAAADAAVLRQRWRGRKYYDAEKKRQTRQPPIHTMPHACLHLLEVVQDPCLNPKATRAREAREHAKHPNT